MIEQYKTLYKKSISEVIEKKSRFIAVITPVQSEKEADVFIEAMRKKYRDARHHVFAYRIGTGQVLERYSDDGEPSGTAGKPILEILRGYPLTNLAVVVIRYFGGVLLGTGGLVRAYGGSTKEALSHAQIIIKKLYHLVHIHVEYALTGKVQYEILHDNHSLYHTEYAEKVQFQVLVEFKRIDSFKNHFIDITNNQVLINNMGLYYGMKVENKMHIEKVL